MDDDFLKIVCRKTEPPTQCKPVQRKDKTIIIPKWWCFNCKRYVLPDGLYHYEIR